MNAEDREALAEALMAKWKRESEEEMASLPATVDPEFLSPVTDTSHGELALEYADALAPVVDAIAEKRARRRAAEELRAAADDMPGKPGTNPAQDWLLARADELEAE